MRHTNQNNHLYDFSNYPTTHPLFSEQNKGVLGTFKDETKSLPIAEFVGLRSKLYAYVFYCFEVSTDSAVVSIGQRSYAII
jgi:hypothetical protein